MADAILDGTGKGFRAAVDSSNRLKVNATSTNFKHLVAHTDSNSFQVIGISTPVSGTSNIIHVKNIDADGNDLMPICIRMQLLNPSGGSSLPNGSNYFSITLEEIYASGGSTAIPINTTSGSTKLSSTIVYINSPTLSGSVREIERWYPNSDGDFHRWGTDDVLIVPPGNTMNIRYIGDHTSGVLYSSVSFIMNRIN